MSARQESCGFTGHRPEKLPWGYEESDPRCIALKCRIRDAVESVWRRGYRHFLCGMAMGCDLYFGECVRELRRELPGITLEAVIPFPGQSQRWPVLQRERYRDLLESCDYHTVVSQNYTTFCMLRRDRYLVDHASVLIAAFGGFSGGTRYTIEYALRQGIEVVDLPIEPDH